MRASLCISLPADLAEWIDNKLKTGRYTSRSEIIREALREKEEKELFADLEESREDLKLGRVVKAKSLADLR